MDIKEEVLMIIKIVTIAYATTEVTKLVQRRDVKVIDGFG